MTKTATTKHTTTESSLKKILSGVVVSDKMKDTVTVLVERFVKVPKYNKYVTMTKKYKAHDAGNTKKIGDKVQIQECRPISKDKHFIVIA
jgi:small subunit ribosomal protein S17